MKKRFFCISIICVLFLSSLSFAQDANTLRKNLITSAEKYLGVPYAWGGTSANGMDCSGFVTVTVKDGTGISLPRTTTEIFNYVDIIPFNKAEPGDLVFFKDGSTVSHVGIYLGGINFIHSASDGPRTGVIISNLNESYWQRHFFATGSFLPSTGIANGNSNNDSSTTVTVKPGANSNYNNPSSPTRVSFGYKDFDNASVILDIDAAFSYNLFNSQGFDAEFDGGKTNIVLKFIGKTFDFGFGSGMIFSSNLDHTKIPLFVTFGVPFGFSFDIGSFFTSTTKETFFDSKNVPFYANVSWQSPRILFDGIGLSLVQNITWSGALKNAFLSVKDNFISGLNFSTGIRMSVGF